MKFSFLIVLFGALCGCNRSTPDYEVKRSSLPIARAAEEELKWSPLTAKKMTWSQAWRYCESLAAEGNSWWRLPSAIEQYAVHGYSQYSTGVWPSPDRMWSALIHESGTHYAVNIGNGAKTRFGDDDSARVECVAGYSATVDAEAWLMELYNARLMNNPGRAAAVLRRLANAGLPDAQLEFGNAYLNGDGLPRDIGEARKWYARARDQGQAFAAENLRQLDAGMTLPPPGQRSEPVAAAAPPHEVAPEPSFHPQMPLSPPYMQSKPQNKPLEEITIGLKIPTFGKAGEESDVMVQLMPINQISLQWLNSHVEVIRDASIQYFVRHGVPVSDDDPARPAREAALLRVLNNKTGKKEDSFSKLSIMVEGIAY